MPDRGQYDYNHSTLIAQHGQQLVILLICVLGLAGLVLGLAILGFIL